MPRHVWGARLSDAFRVVANGEPLAPVELTPEGKYQASRLFSWSMLSALVAAMALGVSSLWYVATNTRSDGEVRQIVADQVLPIGADIAEIREALSALEPNDVRVDTRLDAIEARLAATEAKLDIVIAQGFQAANPNPP